MSRDYLPCLPDRWLAALADGWRFSCLDDALPVIELIPWNCDWPVILLVREAQDT